MQWMSSHFRKRVSFFATSFFLLSILIFSFHSHVSAASTRSEKDCSICQLTPQQKMEAISPAIVATPFVFHTSIDSFSSQESFSDFITSVFIRGPPH